MNRTSRLRKAMNKDCRTDVLSAEQGWSSFHRVTDSLERTLDRSDIDETDETKPIGAAQLCYFAAETMRK